MRIHKNDIEYFRSSLLLFIIHHELAYLLDPTNNSSISDNFPLKLSGTDIEIENEYSAHSNNIKNKIFLKIN